jgi:hypothetical protein
MPAFAHVTPLAKTPAMAIDLNRVNPITEATIGAAIKVHRAPPRGSSSDKADLGSGMHAAVKRRVRSLGPWLVGGAVARLITGAEYTWLRVI